MKRVTQKKKDTISSIIQELKEIQAEHGDISVVGKCGGLVMIGVEKYSVTPNFPSSKHNLLDFWELEETLPNGYSVEGICVRILAD